MNGKFLPLLLGFYQLLIQLEEGKEEEGKGENEAVTVCVSVSVCVYMCVYVCVCKGWGLFCSDCLSTCAGPGPVCS